MYALPKILYNQRVYLKEAANLIFIQTEGGFGLGITKLSPQHQSA